jgi:hypothetical protein
MFFFNVTVKIWNRAAERAVPSAHMSAVGHSRPIHSAPVPTNVRYATNSDRQDKGLNGREVP